MERLTKKKVRSLSDREIKTAYERIDKDRSNGLLNDERTSLENAILLEEEISHRKGSLKKLVRLNWHLNPSK